eukprot:scaffold20.g7629.t1
MAESLAARYPLLAAVAAPAGPGYAEWLLVALRSGCAGVNEPGPCGITPLHLAATLPNRGAAVTALLLAGANTMAWTLQLSAAQVRESSDVLCRLLRAVCNADIERMCKDKMDLTPDVLARAMTPLQLAVLFGRRDAVECLLAATPGALDATLLTEWGLTPFSGNLLATMMFNAQGHWCHWPVSQYCEMLGHLARHASRSLASFTAWTAEQQLHCCMLQLLVGDEPLALRLIQAHHAHCRQSDLTGWHADGICAALFVSAAEKGLANVLAALLAVVRRDGSHPFRLNAPWQELTGVAPLAAAAKSNSLGALALLLARGADAMEVDGTACDSDALAMAEELAARGITADLSTQLDSCLEERI